MFRQVIKGRTAKPVRTQVFAKAEEDNPLIRANENRPLAERVRTSTSRLTDRERAIYQSVQDAVQALTNSADTAFARRLVAEGVEQVLNGVSVGQFISELQPMVDALTQEIQRAGTAHISSLPSRISAQMRFDYLDPRAVQWANLRAGELVTALVDDQRSVLRNVISQGVQDQLTVDEIARNVRDVVGLPESWANAVPKARAREFAKLIGEGKSSAFASQKADAAAEKYKDRLVRARAKTIARTEIMTAQNQGRWLSWAQGTEQGFIPRNAKKEWVAAPGIGPKPHLCEVCRELDGMQAPWDKPFPGSDVNMPPLHPNCRCTAVLVPIDMEQLEQMVAIPDAEYERAQSFIDRAASAEPVVTEDMRATAQRLGGELVGLENKLKSRNSFARKMMNDVRESGVPLSPQQAAEGIRDTLRYTIQIPKDQYANSVRQYLLDLQAQGLDFKSKIRWSRPDTYHGVNLTIRNPKTGQWFELQFHTPESLATKNKIHPFFEKHRTLLPDDPRKQELVDKMVNMAGDQPFPPNIQRIIGLIL